MWPYWLMYLVPAVPALMAPGRFRRFRSSMLTPWIFLGVGFALLIGFRYKVGGDWGAYQRMYKSVIGVTPFEAIATGDPGYMLLNWLMASVGWEVYGVNLVCGAVFISGLIAFCVQQYKPWLAFAVAVPYLIVVVAMGYTRQGVALGLFFWALSYLEQRRFMQYFVFTAVAVLFHKSAVLMIPLGIFVYGKGWTLRVVAVALAAYGLWDALVAADQERLWNVYVEEQMESQGARIRVFMNLVPSLLLLVYWKQWKARFPNPWFWLAFAVGSVVCVVLVDFASTAVDRVALYLMPIQVAVFSRLPYLARKDLSPQTATLGIVLGYAAVLYVWLNYATHSKYWLPYQNILFGLST